MRITSPRGIIAYEISKAMVVAESHRSVPTDLMKRDVIRESIDKYYKDSYGHSLTEFRQIKLEIDILNEELDMLMCRDLPNLSESLMRNPTVLSEGAILPGWVNMILPFVGMGMDSFIPGSGVVLDIVNSLDTFFGAETFFDYVLSGIFLIMAIPVAGDAAGGIASPVAWIADKIDGAKGMTAKVIKKIVSWGPFKSIAEKVINVITPLLSQFKPGGKVFEFVNGMWQRIPKDTASKLAGKIKEKGGAEGILGTMAKYLSMAIDKIKNLFGIAKEAGSKLVSNILAKGQVDALKNMGVSSLADDAAAAAGQIVKAGDDVAAAALKNAKGVKYVDPKSGAEVVLQGVKQNVDGAFVATYKSAGDTGSTVLTTAVKELDDDILSGMLGGPNAAAALRRADDTIPAVQKQLLDAGGASMDDFTRVVAQSPPGARVDPTDVPDVGMAVSSLTSPTAQAGRRTAGPPGQMSTMDRLRVEDPAAWQAIRKEPDVAVRSRMLRQHLPSAGPEGQRRLQQAMELRNVAEHRLNSSSAYLDGLIDLTTLLG